jgi:hypothetical protein
MDNEEAIKENLDSWDEVSTHLHPQGYEIVI